MRVLACIMVLVTLIAGAFLGYCYYGAQIEVEGVSVSTVPVVEALGTYNEVKDQIAQGSFMGTVYRQEESLMPENYAFLTLTVRMKNNGLLPQDWIQITVEPDPADIAMLYNERTPTLAGSSRADFSATLLTHSGADTTRTVTIAYYVLGRPFSTTYQMQ